MLLQDGNTEHVMKTKLIRFKKGQVVMTKSHNGLYDCNPIQLAWFCSGHGEWADMNGHFYPADALRPLNKLERGPSK